MVLESSLRLCEDDENHPNERSKHLTDELGTVEDERNIQQRDKIIKLLEAYDEQAGTNTSEFRAKLLKRGNDPQSLKKFKAKLDRVADKEWLRRAANHEAFHAPGKLGILLRKEMCELHEAFQKQDLLDGPFNKFALLISMNDLLNAKAKFVKRYKKQSPLVIELYEQAMNSLGFIASKEKLLDDVLKIVGDLESSPQAIQSEFMKRAKKIGNADELKVLKAKLIKEYEAMAQSYEIQIKKNAIYFGGDSAKEFVEWFRDQSSFAKMRYALHVLPNYIAERRKEHEKINELLQGMDEKKAKRFKLIIGKLGLSERKAYRKNILEPALRSGGLIVAEYEGELISAHHAHIALYTEIERKSLSARFKKLKLKEQKQVLAVERINIADRKKIIKDYKALPEKVRNDEAFLRANALSREQMLFDAREKLKELEGADAFTYLAEKQSVQDRLTDENIHEITSLLHGEHAESEMQDILHAARAEQRALDQYGINLFEDLVADLARKMMEEIARRLDITGHDISMLSNSLTTGTNQRRLKELAQQFLQKEHSSTLETAA